MAQLKSFLFSFDMKSFLQAALASTFKREDSVAVVTEVV